jgi:hypothetical protein
VSDRLHASQLNLNSGEEFPWRIKLSSETVPLAAFP